MASCSSDDMSVEVMLGKFLSDYIDVILESRDPYANSHVIRNNSLSGGWKNGVVSSMEVNPKPLCKLQTMVVDVILEQSTLDGGKVQSLKEGMVFQDLRQKRLCVGYDSTELDDQGSVGTSKMTIERWVLEYDGKKNYSDCKGKQNRRVNRMSHLHKRLTILWRSLYSFIRLLPAYAIFHQLRSSNNINLSYSIRTRVSTLVVPFNFREKALLQRFKFAPVDSSCGRLCVSVVYRSSGYDLVLKKSPSRSLGVASQSLSPVLITDYVGSPSVEPFRRFPTGTATCSLSSSKLRGSNEQGSQTGYFNADTVVGAMKNQAIVQKACYSIKGKTTKNHAGKMSSSIIIREPSFTGSPGLFSQGANENSNINFPFDVHGDDPIGFACGSGSFHQNNRAPQFGESLPFGKSHEATVGSLVDMLNKAAPLQRDTPDSSNASYKKTTADAFEELKIFRETKEDLPMLGDGSRALVTSDSGLEPANELDKDLGSS